MNLSNITIKRPSKEDAAELAPVVVTVLVWAFVADRSSRTAKTMLIPAFAGVTVWVLLKGLRYVPR